MPFPEDMGYARLEFSAGPGTEEIQTTGFWWRLQTPGIIIDLDWPDAVNTMAEKIRDSWTDDMPASAFGFNVTARRVVVYHYDQAHNNVLHRGEAAFGPTDWKGSAGSLPLQDALVVGLYGYDPTTFVPNRADKRGRMYLPTLGKSQTDDYGMLTDANRDTLLDAFAAFWADLQGDISTGGPSSFNIQPVISSNRLSIATDASWLRMGLVIDTQRRRRNALNEDYSTVHVT